MDEQDLPHLVNIQEMARILGVHVNWLYQRTRLGHQAIPHLKVGRYVRFDVDEVMNFLKKNRDIGNQGYGVVS